MMVSLVNKKDISTTRLQIEDVQMIHLNSKITLYTYIYIFQRKEKLEKVENKKKIKIHVCM